MLRWIALRPFAKILFGVVAFAVLLLAITGRPTKRLNDFDQSFYLTIAYDLGRYGIFSNGIFDAVDSTAAAPSPGMFFGPVYPLLVLAATKADARFAAAVTCAVESNHGKRDGTSCDIYARPIHVMHALLLALGVIAIALAAELITGQALAFFLAGALATIGLALEAELFSFIMTESVTFTLYSLMTLAMVAALKSGRPRYFFFCGGALGLLCLTRASYLVLAAALPVAFLAGWRMSGRKGSLSAQILVFVLAFVVTIAPWLARNSIALGTFRFTEEYGSASLVERFAYNAMTAREFAVAFPYCLPEVGPWAIGALFGENAMARFDWKQPGGFFDAGRARRVDLVAQHGKLDPVIGALVRDELGAHGWQYLISILPLAWCGLWVAGLWSLVLIPVLAWSCVNAWRRSRPMLLLYASPAITMVGLHAAVANHYARYNLGLIGPIAVGVAVIALHLLAANTQRARTVHPPEGE